MLQTEVYGVISFGALLYHTTKMVLKLMFTEEPKGNEASVVKVGSQATTPDK